MKVLCRSCGKTSTALHEDWRCCPYCGAKYQEDIGAWFAKKKQEDDRLLKYNGFVADKIFYWQAYSVAICIISSAVFGFWRGDISDGLASAVVIMGIYAVIAHILGVLRWLVEKKYPFSEFP